jgi:uncharacterized protein YcfJ
METTTRLNRIHPLMAAAAVSVIIVSVAGAAAITGILPSSHGAPEPQSSAIAPGSAALGYAPAPAAAPIAAPVAGQMAMPVAANYPQPAPAVEERKPAVKHTVQHARPVHHTTEVARNDEPSYEQRPAPQAAPKQPNYIGIGAGALIGGVLGNQVGKGNGKKLATVAGIIGGGVIGNEVANRNR